MLKRYKLIFFVRFMGYLIFFSGITSLVFVMGPLIQAESGYRFDQISGVKRTVADTSVLQNPGNNASDEGGGFGNIKPAENEIVPVSTEYGIVIEKINANARIVPNINPGNEREYISALGSGVAEALGSTPPGQPGNLYLFSHSTDAPWNIVRYNAIFYLLRELTPGDRVVIFYQNKRYDYIVFDKVIAKPTEVSYLTNKYEFPVLTLQTCDPPGTLINRLIVRARLVNS